LVGQRYRRKPPQLYTNHDVVRLIQSAAALPSAKQLRGRTYPTLFGLLAVTGLRINEALHLDRSDVDLLEGVLTIRRTKFGKSRLVPIHPTTQEALHVYGEARDRIIPTSAPPAFFLSERRTRITEWMTRYTFAVVSRRVGLRPPTRGGRHGHGPRIQDLRHRFAAQTLIAWYRAGIDVERELPKLSTYLGHVHTADTYWYLEAIPDLLQLAAERLAQTPTGGHAMIAASFQSLLQSFFTERLLLRQRQASPHTIAGYRDTFRLLLRFAADQLGKASSRLKTEDFAPTFVGRFLEHLEQRRGSRSRRQTRSWSAT
jgi:integrase/recombinase XerD